jgi:hypothetical protein
VEEMTEHDVHEALENSKNSQAEKSKHTIYFQFNEPRKANSPLCKVV